MKKIIYAILLTNRNHVETSDLVNGIKGITDTDIYTISFNDISIAVSDFTSRKRQQIKN